MAVSKITLHYVQTTGGSNEAAAAFPWNTPKKAVNPYLDTAEVAPESALSNLIALYAADNEQEQLHRERLSDEVWERYFFNESRDPVQREMEQDRLISHAKTAREQQRFNPDLVIIADVGAQPTHISKPLLERIKYFHSLGRAKTYSRYLRETIRPCLERLERVRDSQVSASFRFMASHDGLEGLLVLPEMNQDQVKRLSTLVAAHMSMCLDASCGDLFVSDDVKPEEIRQAWERVAAEAMRLEVIPPAFEKLRRKKYRRKPVPYELIPPSLARMLCADWWYRKLWQMRCEWREEQLRAVCLVNKKASPYVSYEAVIHKREQRRKSLEFFRSHELVNEDGDTLDMEDVVNASNLFNDGNNWQGIVESLTLPKFTRKFEKYRGGGMPGAVDVDMGLDDGALDTEFSIGGTELLLFRQMGKATVDGIQLRFTGSIQRDDTGEVQAVELVVRGRHKEVDSGEWKTGESSTTKVSSTNSYAKLTINGEVLYEVDLVNMVEIVDGVDLMEEHRNALGL